MSSCLEVLSIFFLTYLLQLFYRFGYPGIFFYLNFYWLSKFQKKSFKSSCPQVFCKKGVLGNFAKFTGKHLCQSLFFNKVAGLRPVDFATFLRTLFLTEQLWWLHLNFVGYSLFCNKQPANKQFPTDLVSYLVT